MGKQAVWGWTRDLDYNEVKITECSWTLGVSVQTTVWLFWLLGAINCMVTTFACTIFEHVGVKVVWISVASWCSTTYYFTAICVCVRLCRRVLVLGIDKFLLVFNDAWHFTLGCLPHQHVHAWFAVNMHWCFPIALAMWLVNGITFPCIQFTCRWMFLQGLRLICQEQKKIVNTLL